MKKCPYCAENIQDAAVVCRYCGRDLLAAAQQSAAVAVVSPAKPKLGSRILKLAVYALFVIAAGTVLIALFSNSDTNRPKELTTEQRLAVQAALTAKELWQPNSLRLESNGFIVAEYEISHPDQLHITVRQLGESALLGIREALLPFGYKDYRVNMNGPPPGTGLILRYGAARYIEGGSVEWIKP